MQVTADVENIGPSNLEKVCGEIVPAAKARIVEIEDARGHCIQTYQGQWTLEQTTSSVSFFEEFNGKVAALEGRVVRYRIAVPVDLKDTTEVPNESYIECTVPMVAKTRREACRGLSKALADEFSGTAEISRDCLETIHSMGRFYVTMRFPDMSMQCVKQTIVSLYDFLRRWKKSYARVEENSCATRIVYDIM